MYSIVGLFLVVVNISCMRLFRIIEVFICSTLVVFQGCFMKVYLHQQCIQVIVTPHSFFLYFSHFMKIDRYTVIPNGDLIYTSLGIIIVVNDLDILTCTVSYRLVHALVNFSHSYRFIGIVNRYIHTLYIHKHIYSDRSLLCLSKNTS